MARGVAASMMCPGQLDTDIALIRMGMSMMAIQMAIETPLTMSPGPARFEDGWGLVGRESKETPNIIPAYKVIWLCYNTKVAVNNNSLIRSNWASRLAM